MNELVVTATADGGMLVSNAIEARRFIEGHYAPAPVAHAHKGASGEVRPVFAWDRPLSEQEANESRVALHQLRAGPAQACCVVS